ncbi:hypothetical protein ACFFX1_37225 [Dactylosporangium sucinum]|uniref:Cucumopine synthase C-terminal helical bundle domain-containing protein n=1 Tax=Dactylosporangium sucinum TaxID=1424081 RepID=A0A917UE78_9ACTN|nr:hypothetical protein [Dactylosporangium sucinum]GGM81509.1 hypothetical protein GCM10007977_098640 [Dactylosporangium sucinum]
MPAKAEIRKIATSVEDVIALLDAERDAIWECPPDEVMAMCRGEIPRGTGTKNTYLTTLIFAENELRTFTDEILWFAWELAAVKEGADLRTLQLYMDEMCQYKANMIDFVGLPRAGELVKEYVGGVNACKTLDEFARLTGAAMTYINRLHGWVDMAFPWGVTHGYTRSNPLDKIVKAARAAQ